MRRSPADSTKRSLAAFGKLQHIPRSPGVVPPVQTSRPTAPPARPYYAVVRRTRRRGGTVRGAAVRVGWGRPPRGVAGACCAREATS